MELNRAEYDVLRECCEQHHGDYARNTHTKYRLAGGDLEYKTLEEYMDRFCDGISRHRWTEWRPVTRREIDLHRFRADYEKDEQVTRRHEGLRYQATYSNSGGNHYRCIAHVWLPGDRDARAFSDEQRGGETSGDAVRRLVEEINKALETHGVPMRFTA